MITDTHSHLFTEEFSDDLPQVIQRAKENGITRILMPNIDLSTVEQMLFVCNQYKGYLYPMLGFHPTSILDKNSFRKELLEMRHMLEKENPFIAIGEVGLDLYWDKTFQFEQEEAFVRQIEWALEFNLPLAIHSRSAHQLLVEIMSHYKKESRLCGVFHSFSGNEDEAGELLEFENFCLGINGILTFKKSQLPEILKNVPLNRIVLETDSPYLAPTPYRGKRNESSFLVSVLKVLEQVYEMPETELEKVIEENVCRLFKKVGRNSCSDIKVY